MTSCRVRWQKILGTNSWRCRSRVAQNDIILCRDLSKEILAAFIRWRNLTRIGFETLLFTVMTAKTEIMTFNLQCLISDWITPWTKFWNSFKIDCGIKIRGGPWRVLKIGLLQFEISITKVKDNLILNKQTNSPCKDAFIRKRPSQLYDQLKLVDL